MTRIALIAFLLALGLIAHAQEQDLTTVEPANSEELLAPYMKQLKMGCKMHYSGGRQELELRKKLKALGYLTDMNRAPTRIKVTSHVILPATCIDLDFHAPTWQEVIDDIDYANEWFGNEGFNIRLQLQGDPNNICDEDWYDLTDYSAADYCDLNTEHGVNGHLNVYYVNDGSNAVTFPWDINTCVDNMVVLQNDHAGWGWTLVHEVGHWFGLYHTFETGNGSEKVTRDPNDSCWDCEDEGDLLCDTPADYGTDWCDEGTDNCSCSGHTDVDNCGGMSGSVDNDQEDSCDDQYEDDIVLNIMAYGCRPCAHDFTQGQVDRMWTFVTARLLQSSIKHTDCADDYTFSGTRSSNGVRAEANVKVTSSEDIRTEQYVLYDGDSRVILNQGFRAEPYSAGGETRYPNVEMRTEGCWGNYQFVKPTGGIVSIAQAKEELRAIANRRGSN